MFPVLTSPPTIEPISLTDAKAHLRVETIAEDLLIAGLIATSRMRLERHLGLALIAQGWSIFLDAWPDPSVPLELPVAPLMSLVAVRFYDASDAVTTLPLAEFQLDRVSRPVRLVRRIHAPLPADRRRLASVEIAVTAGYGTTPADVPAPLRQALLQLIAHAFEHRDLSIDTAVPPAIATQLAPWRTLHIGR